MTSDFKKPTHIDGSYRFYIDANTIHAENSTYAKVKRCYKRCLILTPIIGLLLCVFIYWNQYDRITICERSSLDTPVHCTITHHYKYWGSKLIASIDIKGVEEYTFSAPNSTVTNVYSLISHDDNKTYQIKAENIGKAGAFGSQVTDLISIADNSILPKKIDTIRQSQHKFFIRWVLKACIFLILFGSIIVYVFIKNMMLGVELIHINRKDREIILAEGRVCPLGRIKHMDINKEGKNHIILSIYILGSNKIIKIIGKDLKLHEQIKTTLEQWAKEAKLADQNKQ